MKLVTLTRDLRPHSAGADLLLPPDVADRLIAEGGAENPRDRFGNPWVEPPVVVPSPHLTK